MTNKSYLHEDIQDSPEDQKKLKGEQGVLDLPELKDIPGALRSGKNASTMPGDTTISSADEEGDELLESDDESGDNVTSLEKKLLRESFDPSYDVDLPVSDISLDDTDNEGDPLEERSLSSGLFGKDLDSGLEKEEDEETDGANQQ